MIDLPFREFPVLSIKNPSKDAFDQLVKNAKPFKVQEGISHWSLMQDFSQITNPLEQCDFLIDIVKNKEVNYTILPFEQRGSIRLDDELIQNFSFSSKKTSFYSFMNHVKNCLNKNCTDTLYLQASLIMELLQKINVTNLFKGFHPSSQPLFWIGTGNQFVGLHNDPFRNIIALFSGRKRIILFPPDDLPHLYPAPFDRRSGGAISSLIDIFNPDLKKFPLFKKAVKNVIIAYLEPGEFLYLPPLWWHAVESEGFNVGLNCWFYDDGMANKLYKLYTPAESLAYTISQKNISYEKKMKLYKMFNDEPCVSYFDSFKKADLLAIQVIRASRKIKKTIHKAFLSVDQKNIWREWVKVFTFWYVFGLKKKPFPSLPKEEFQNMLGRQKKDKKKQIFCLPRIRPKFSKIDYKKEKKMHAIVPSF